MRVKHPYRYPIVRDGTFKCPEIGCEYETATVEKLRKHVRNQRDYQRKKHYRETHLFSIPAVFEDTQTCASVHPTETATDGKQPHPDFLVEQLVNAL